MALLWHTLAAACLCCLPAAATQPPRPGELDAYRKDGSLAERRDFVLRTGNHRVRADVAQRTLRRLETARESGRVPLEILPNWQGMPTVGTNNVLVFLVDFPDYPHVNAQPTISNKLFGAGSPAEYPLESLRSYYIRSSYSNLFLQGEALGWYTMQHDRSWYTTTYGTGNEANRAVINEIVQHFDAANDFSGYDNNGDGFVDYFAVIWAGPDNGWGNFWWGYQWQLNTPIAADGVQFRDFSWQWESRPVGAAYEAGTIIHETGHALGLPDYYDYDPGVGPEGGLGGLDMMDSAQGDHNAFSKFMLDWIRPQFLFTGQTSVVLQASAAFPSAAAVMPGYAGGSPFREYFMVQNRHRMNNDTDNPSDGLLLWHVDATPNARGDDFAFNNSDTTHKLLRLMEADGLESIEHGNGNADAGDYYNAGDALSPYGTPNSQSYDGSNTWVTVDSISADGVTMTARVSVESLGGKPIMVRSPTALSQSLYASETPTGQTFRVRSDGGFAAYTISVNATWLNVSPAAGSSSNDWVAHAVSYDKSELSAGTHQARITVESADSANPSVAIDVSLLIMDTDVGSAVDATNLTWTGGGAAFWFQQYSVSQDGADAAQSGPIGDSETSYIETVVTGPGALSFWWKVSSEQDYDYLRFDVDGATKPSPISGLTEWQQQSHLLTAGEHTLRWTYSKDGSVSSGSDAAWLDRVSFISGSSVPIIERSPESFSRKVALGAQLPTDALDVRNAGGGAMAYALNCNAAWLSISPSNEVSSGSPNQHRIQYSTAALTAGVYRTEISVTSTSAVNAPVSVPVALTVFMPDPQLADAVDATQLLWTTSGDSSWYRQTAAAHDGSDAAQSGAIPDDGTCALETTVEGPGTLHYWCRVSSEEGYDFLNLFIDDVDQVANLSGSIDWHEEIVPIPAGGTHRVRWAYMKDYGTSAGSDAAWIDQVSFEPGIPEATSTLLAADFGSGLAPGWTVTDKAGSGIEWLFNDPAGRGNLTGGTGPFAIADSDYAGEVAVDTSLVTPELHFGDFTNIVLEFKTDFLPASGYESAAVEYSLDGTTWSQAWLRFGTEIAGPATVRINLSALAGQTNAWLAFRYYDANWDWWWQLDDIRVYAVQKQTPPPPLIGIQSLNPGGGFELRWSGVQGEYTLQFSTNLVEGLWHLAPGWTSNTPAESVMSYTNILPYPFAAYRLLWKP